MGRPHKALTPLKVKSLNEKGRHADGGGLYLQISKWGTKSWVFRYQMNGRRREMGMGPISDVTLAEAREQAKAQRAIIREGYDPKLRRDSVRQDISDKQSWTFDRCAQAYITAHSPSWTNEKHVEQWRNTLKKFANPVFGDLPVSEVDRAMVMRVIEPLWLTKTETASRLRGRIEKVLSWAIVNDYRDAPNPAIWRGNLEELLPKRSKIADVKHHAALPYKEIALFMQGLRQHENLSSLALRFTILTACRTQEVLGADWSEIDIKDRVWTIPKNRMKTKREQRVPLSDEALEVLEILPRLDGWMFPSSHAGKHLSNVAMLAYLKGALGRSDLTVHGFRSTFRDWAAEVSPFPRELAEAALAHVLGDKTEAAYQRGDLLEKRRELMQEWASYVNANDDDVISLNRLDSRK